MGKGKKNPMIDADPNAVLISTAIDLSVTAFEKCQAIGMSGKACGTIAIETFVRYLGAHGM